MKSILIEDEFHEKVKNYSKRSGIKIKILVETAINSYINKMSFQEQEKEEEKQNG